MPRFSAAGSAARWVSRVTSFVREDPVLVAIAAGVALVFLLGLVLLVRRHRRSPGTRFVSALSRPSVVTVLMHPNPDPDAMACALGVARLADHADTTAIIQYPGQIRHQENRAFRTVLDLTFESIEGVDDLADETVVLVDHNEPRGFDGCEDVEPYAVVDHHPGDGEGEVFTDVRPEYGACASIVTEYFEDVGLRPADPKAEDGNGNRSNGSTVSSSVATGMLYGILSDTDNLTRGCSPAEFAASAYLYPGIDEDALHRIANPLVDTDVLDTIALAITKRDVRGSFLVSDVGTLSNLDALPQAADELLRLEGVTAVVVLGDKTGTIHLSGRSRDDRVHMGHALATAVEDIPQSDAGGHARMAGGQVSMAHLGGPRSDARLAREDFKEGLFDVMAGDV